MKRTIFTLCALFATLSLFSQSEYNFPSDWEYYHLEQYPTKIKPNQKVKKAFYEVTEVKRNKTHKIIKHFNDQGNLLKYILVDKNNDSIPKGIFEYDQKGELSAIQLYKEKKINNTISYKRGSFGNILDYQIINRKNRITVHKKWEYNPKGNVTQSISFKKGTTDTLSKWQYDYYEDGKKAKTTLYDRKGRVKMAWSYQCNQEGAKLEKREKETQVCQWKKTADNYLVYAYQTFNEKGKIIKNVFKYSIKDTLLMEQCVYNELDSLTYKATYNKSFERPISQTNYHKGKKTYQTERIYNNNLLTKFTHLYKGKVTSSSEYIYNENGMISEIKYYNRKGKPTRIIKIKYEL